MESLAIEGSASRCSSRPQSAAPNRQQANSRQASARPSSARVIRPPSARPDGIGAQSKVRPDFVFRRAAMTNIAEWMVHEADNRERRELKKVHELLGIESSAAVGATPSGPAIAKQPASASRNSQNSKSAPDPEIERLNVQLTAIKDERWRSDLRTTNQDHFSHSVPPATRPDAKTKEKVWQLLGRIVNDNAVDYLSSRINQLQSTHADLVWDVFQKLAANEEVVAGGRDTTTGTAHCWNPFFVKDARRRGYPNLSNALPISKLFYPPWMDPPAQGSAKHKPKKRQGWKSRCDNNPMTIASTVAKHPNDSPPHTPKHKQKELFYGLNLNQNGAPGGPHTTSTNMAVNPYWEPGRPEPEPAKAQLKPARLESARPASQRPASAITRRKNGPGKVLSGGSNDSQKGQQSSVALDLGLPMPCSEYSGTYKNHVNAKPGSFNNPSHMPTQCITGMGPAGAGVNPSGAPAVGTNSHLEFLKRISMSRDSGRPKTKRPQTAQSCRSRPQSAQTHS